MKKIAIFIFLFLAHILAYAESIKIDPMCWQNYPSSMMINVPIKLDYKKLKVAYNKFLHIECFDNYCNAMTMDTDLKKEGVVANSVSLIEGIKRTTNKRGYVVLEWGINVVTADFNSKKISWRETGVPADEMGIGEASCK